MVPTFQLTAFIILSVAYFSTTLIFQIQFQKKLIHNSVFSIIPHRNEAETNNEIKHIDTPDINILNQSNMSLYNRVLEVCKEIHSLSPDKYKNMYYYNWILVEMGTSSTTLNNNVVTAMSTVKSCQHLHLTNHLTLLYEPNKELCPTLLDTLNNNFTQDNDYTIDIICDSVSIAHFMNWIDEKVNYIQQINPSYQFKIDYLTIDIKQSESLFFTKVTHPKDHKLFKYLNKYVDTIVIDTQSDTRKQQLIDIFTKQFEINNTWILLSQKQEGVHSKLIYKNLQITQISDTRLKNREQKWCQDIFSQYDTNEYGLQYQNHAKLRTFNSQYNQDWFLYSTMFRAIQTSNKTGVYVDLAANHYKYWSNTYFLDKCLQWNGICIEPQTQYHQSILTHRKCELIKDCIWNETKEMIFETGPHLSGNGLSGLRGFNKLKDMNVSIISNETKTCITLQSIFDERGIKHIDFLSLDIEGAELQAIQGIDFNKTQVDVISVEGNAKETNEYLENIGFSVKAKLFEDFVFVHRNANDKLKYFQDWMSNSQFEKYDLTHQFMILNDISKDY